MGCDIHIFAEIKKAGKWEKVGKIFHNPYYDAKEESKTDKDGYEYNAKFIDEPYSGRNYDLFAILADVRNGRGFAGIKTGEGFNPIFSPKGLPENVSMEINDISDRWDGDGHSHSFLTLSELLNYDWNQIVMLRGSVSLEQYKKLKETGGCPDNYCADISGGKIVTIEEQEADKFLDKTEKMPKNLEGKQIFVNYHWTETYKQSAGERFFETIESLKKLGNPEDVRIVFWFDN